MAPHDTLVPIRFLALVGQFFAALLALYAVRDNVIVALPFRYDQQDFDDKEHSARIALLVGMGIMFVNAVGFFGGFSTFDLPMSIFRAPRSSAAQSCLLASLTCSPAPQTSLHTQLAACSSRSSCSTRRTTCITGTLSASSADCSCSSSSAGSCRCAYYGSGSGDGSSSSCSSIPLRALNIKPNHTHEARP